MPATPELLRHILTRVKAVDTGYTSKCLLWQGALDTSGYSVIKVKGRQHQVHLLMKTPPKGMEIDHLCRIRNCINPKHLEVVTQAENKRRANAIRFGKVET